ncbi:MAG: hypothetical protein ACI38A_08525 [Candidatus Ornithomonoglobus sp.]
MNKKILNILNTTAGQLIFSLLAGGGYFMIILKFIISASNGSAFLAYSFSPLIICGAALVIVKLMKQARENENPGAIIKLFWIHIAVIAVGIVFLISAFM